MFDANPRRSVENRAVQAYWMTLLLCSMMACAGCATMDTRGFVLKNPKVLHDWDKDLQDKYTQCDSNGKDLEFVVKYNDDLAKVDARCAKKFGGTDVLEGYRKTLAERLVAQAQSEEDLAKREKDLAEAAASLTKAQLAFVETTEKATMDNATEQDVKKAREAKNAARSKENGAKTAVATAKVAATRAAWAVKIAEAPLEPLNMERRRLRNAVLGELVLMAQAFHRRYDYTMHVDRSSVNIGLDAGQLAATAAASVTGSETTARYLAAIATATQGFQESVDKRIFNQHATSALLSIMHKQRMEKEAILVEKMRLTVEEYPLEVALDDYAAYLSAGSLVDALRQLSSEAGAEELEELQALNELRKRSDKNLKSLVEAREKKQAAEQEIEALDRQIEKKAKEKILEALSGSLSGTAAAE